MKLYIYLFFFWGGGVILFKESYALCYNCSFNLFPGGGYRYSPRTFPLSSGNELSQWTSLQIPERWSFSVSSHKKIGSPDHKKEWALRFSLAKVLLV